jgi:predicted N-acyltransferase
MPRLIERFTEIPDLPTKDIREFREFTQMQGWELLKTLNDWLESRRAKRLRKNRRSAVRAGLHLYAYVDPVSRQSE